MQKKIASQILAHTKWSGFAMFEFKESADGKVSLIEVNPRVWGSINQGLVNGVNYFTYLLGDSKKNIKSRSNMKTYLSPLIYVSILSQLCRLNFSYVLKFLKSFPFLKSDISFIDDFKGYLSIILKKILR